MARSTIRRLVEQMPEHGLALHATLVGNLESIKRDGLKSPDPGNPVWVCPLPSKWQLVTHSERQFLELVIGSAMIAGGYATNLSVNPGAKTENLPAMVILKGTPLMGFTLAGYPSVFYPSYTTKSYHRYFGAASTKRILPDSVAATVHLTPEEHRQIHSSYKTSRRWRRLVTSKEREAEIKEKEITKAVIRLLARKTLKALREVIEAGAKSK